MSIIASGPGGSGKDELAEMMKSLGLREEDMDDVVFEDEPLPLAEATRWSAIARVHTEREFSDIWFYKQMRSAWDLAQEVKIRSLDDNLYTMQFSCLGDWDKVMEGGPWTFRGHPVLLAPYDGFTKPSVIDLNTFKIWIQIHDLPDGFKPMLGALASKVGEVLTTEPFPNEFSGNFFRVRILCDVRKPLKNAVSMVREKKRQIFLVKYERLPDWCALCGMIGHLYSEHGDGVHPPELLVFKDLKATWAMRAGSTARGRGHGRGVGRGLGRVNMNEAQFNGSCVRQTMEEGDGSEEDPMAVDLNRKRQMNAIQLSGSGTKNGELAAPLVNSLVNQFDNPNARIPPSPPAKRDPKRVRKTGAVGESNDNAVDGSSLEMAGSVEGRRQDQ
jgi:hypothetical protein